MLYDAFKSSTYPQVISAIPANIYFYYSENIIKNFFLQLFWSFKRSLFSIYIFVNTFEYTKNPTWWKKEKIMFYKTEDISSILAYQPTSGVVRPVYSLVKKLIFSYHSFINHPYRSSSTVVKYCILLDIFYSKYMALILFFLKLPKNGKKRHLT